MNGKKCGMDYPGGFMDTHRKFFLQNPRLGMLVNSFDRMPDSQQKTHLFTASRFLDSL